MQTADETYGDVEMLVHSATHAFLRESGIGEGDYEEWHAEACLAFAIALRRFDPRLGNRFSTWLVWSIRNRLMDKRRTEAFHRGMFDARDDDFADPSSGGESRWREFLSSLSDDARSVVFLIVDDVSCRRFREPKPMARWEMQMLVRSLLTDLGWTWERISESFGEIRRILTE